MRVRLSRRFRRTILAVRTSAIVEATPQTATPAFDVAAGTYTVAQSVTITCATPGAAIYYTIDGSAPSAASTLYSGPVSVGSSLTLRAIAIAVGYTNSAVASAAYVINLVTTAAPTLDAFPASPTNVDPVVTTAHGAALAQARVYVGGVEVPLAGGFFDADGLFLVTLLGLSQTTHSVTVTAQAEGEIESDPSNARSVTIDRTAPTAPTITSPATGTTAAATETFVFTGEAGCTGYLHVDGVSTAAVESPAGTYTVADVALSVGANVATATLTDAAGNTSAASAAVTRTRQVVIAPPVITSPVTGTETALWSVVVVGTSEAGRTIRVLLDGVEAATTTADGAGAWTDVVSLPSLDGSYSLTATAGDGLGNVSAPSNAVVVVVARAVGSAQGSTLVKALVQRGVMKARTAFGGVDGVYPAADGTYTANWIRDTYYAAKGSPGYFTSARLRALVDQFVSSVGGDPFGFAAFSAERVNVDGTFVYRPGADWGHMPAFDNGVYLALLAVHCYDMGDTTVFAAHKTALLGVLAAPPRDGTSGLLYSDPALTRNAVATIGWGFEDGCMVSGGLGMVTALHAVAYRELGRIATAAGDAATEATCDAQRTALGAALANLRRVDGFYKPSDTLDRRHAMLTAYLVAEGLLSASDEAASAAALRTEYLAGTITQRGGGRHLVSPDLFIGGEPGTYQNGGYWLGEPTRWFARALKAANDIPAADALVQAAVDEALRQHRIDKGAVWEWGNMADRGAKMNHFGSAIGALVSESQPAYLDATLAGANGSTAEVLVPHGHRVTSFTVTAQGASTVTVVVQGAALVNVLADAEPPAVSYATAQTIGTVALAAETTKTVSSGLTPRAVHGGKIVLSVSAGSAAGNLAVRLHLSAPTISLIDTPTVHVDDFSTDRLAEYATVGTWAVTTGRLRNTTAGDGQAALVAGLSLTDVEIAAVVRSEYVPHRFPCLMARASEDAANGVFVLFGPNVINVYDRAGGVNSAEIGSWVVSLATGEDYQAIVRVVGSTLTVWLNGALVGTATTTRLVAGTAGAFLGSANGAAEVAFDELAIYDMAALAAEQPIPPGYVLEGGARTGLVDDEIPLRLVAPATANLRDATGAIVATVANARWPRVTY